MAKQAPLNGSCASTVGLPGKKADGSIGTLFFTCDRPEPGHKDHCWKCIIGDSTKPSGTHTRCTIIWFDVPNRIPKIFAQRH